MKNNIFKKIFQNRNPMIIISGSALVGTMLLTSCSGIAKNSNGNIVDITNSEEISSSVSDQEIVSTESSITEISQVTETSVNYNFMWDNSATERFSKYVEGKLGVGLETYVRYYGFGGPLNKVYTDYLKENYGLDSNVESVPFSASNYFYSYMVSPSGKRCFRKYETFCVRFLNDERNTKSAFKNKLILSYLIQNDIPLGVMIPAENFESLDENFISIGKEYNLSFYRENPQFGNYDNQHLYSPGDIIGADQIYNNSLAEIFYTEGLKEQDIFKDPELCDILNQHLKTFYGENAIQIGQVPTREQYKAIFGEDPLDLSYIPGAVVNDSQVNV